MAWFPLNKTRDIVVRGGGDGIPKTFSGLKYKTTRRRIILCHYAINAIHTTFAIKYIEIGETVYIRNNSKKELLGRSMNTICK